MKCSPFLGTAVLVALLFPCFAEAQYMPEPEEEYVFPEIMFRRVSISSTSEYSNYLDFWLDWDTGTLPRTPPPLAPGQTQPPRWIYFWKFGDHTYSSDSMPRHVFPDLPGQPDSFDVEVSLKPIYSDDHDPFKKKKKKKVGIPAPSPPGSTTTPIYVDTSLSPVPMIQDTTMAIELEANWRSTHPNGVLTLAITFRPVSPNQVSGRIGLLYAANMLLVDTVEGDFGEGDVLSLQPDYQSLEALRGLTWRFESLSADSGEHTIFVDVRAPENMAQLINDTSSIQFPVYAFIGYDDPQGGNAPGQKKSSLLSRLFGASTKGEGGDGTSTLYADSNNFYQEISEQMTVNWASDPNYIHVQPAVLSPGTSNQLLKYSVHFQNDGSGPARNVAVRVAPDLLLDAPGVVQNPDSSNVPLCLKLKLPFADSLRWDIVTTPPMSDCKLNGLGDAVALGFSTDYTWGRVHYDISTLPAYILQAGDTIRAQGTVYMDGHGKNTPVRNVPVRIPAFCYPGMLGLKYSQHFANDALRSGWGLGLTLRYALGKVQNPNFEAHTLRRIRKQNFPLFWWQGELGYGQTSLRPGTDSLRLCHLDVTPVMLRFIAKKPPLRFGGQTFERGWGLSAGYTASYLLASRRNGADDIAFDQFGFGDRLDHSIAVSADFLNLIGRPGISVGAGWRWRNSQITGTREWYQNAFVYLHYTFSYRFRTEFGWLK